MRRLQKSPERAINLATENFLKKGDFVLAEGCLAYFISFMASLVVVAILISVVC